ncbi:hypothetical protein CJP72_14070 [Citrobacter sp. NCU1]|uniref:hypothetical protein n=1 Tax=Citrobacter sp. NCU1 TaxID=2026683 RepID=UPI0013909DC1|nr:hypothetical protein [Citrobacter sp. NCU1]NDO81850.1 hypothetical protein [Citrobacter sp. NCU1]
MNKRVTGIYLFSTALFAGSLFFPAFSTGTSNADSLALLLTGWMGLFVDPISSFSWLANPLYLIVLVGLLRKKSRDVLFLCALLSFFFALSFLSVSDVIADAGGQARAVTGYHLGCWLWIAASLIMMFGLYFEIKSNKNSELINNKE